MKLGQSHLRQLYVNGMSNKKLTKEEFIARARAVHGNRYDDNVEEKLNGIIKKIKKIENNIIFKLFIIKLIPSISGNC